MCKAKYIATDVETGGIGSDKSLLTSYFIVMDENFQKMADLSLITKPDDKIYVLTAEAMNINQIDIVKHDSEAITEKEAKTKLYEFLREQSNEGSTKLIPIGHNVKFDIDFLTAKIISRESWNKFVSYRILDTGTIGQALKAVRKVPEDVSGSLGSWLKHFEIIDHGTLHTAEADTLATVRVLQCQLELMR